MMTIGIAKNDLADRNRRCQKQLVCLLFPFFCKNSHGQDWNADQKYKGQRT